MLSKMRASLLTAPLLLLVVLSGGHSLRAAGPMEVTREQADFFENEIRPLLIKHCFECHSEKTTEGELRLDGRAHLLNGGASGPAAMPNKPGESLLIQAVQYREIEMPPNGKLPQTDIDKFVRWVEMGLPWPGEETGTPTEAPKSKIFHITDEQRNHWAFRPVKKEAPPAIDDPQWNSNPIDRFLYSRWQSIPISPGQLADRGTLLRRVTFDLTGLPPTEEELDQFLADNSPDAWKKVIERLLASPHYGERWGRHWMDVIRYADTAGDASDYPLPDAYKYRNYIIKSFNDDKPYTQFLREQYAGDLLAKDAPPEQYEELITATTHLALARRFGYNDTNFHYFHLTIQDLLDTMGQSVLGLSIGCARCHDHKFEPISAKDYYSLYGIFSSSKFTFPGAEEVRYPKDLVPAVPPHIAAQLEQERKQKLEELDSRLAELELPLINLEGSFEGTDSIPDRWKRDKEATLISTASSPFTNVFSQGSKSVQLPKSPRNLGIRRPIPVHTPDTTSPLYLNIDFCNVSEETRGEADHRIALDHPENGFSPAVELFMNSNRFAVREGEGFKEIAPLQSGVWYNLQVTVNWSAKQFSGVLASATEQWTFPAIPFNPRWDGIANSWVVDGHVPGQTGNRPERQLDNFAISKSPFLPAMHVAPANGQSVPETRQQLTAQLEPVKKQKEALTLQPVYPTVYGVREGTPANAKIQLRGEPDRLGPEAPRGFLEILGGEQLPADCTESGRRELAGWLTSPQNPLTARVMVNRIWYYHFGRGIVSTPNDFGVRGAPPTHPELLDFLATQFAESGYSIKTMHGLILTSNAYRLSADDRANLKEIDPANDLFARHLRRRLDAESLRDTWLRLSGELDLNSGGPHPFPPIPSWKFSQHNPFDAVFPSNQRTVYLMTQRIKRHPFLALFDGPDTNATTGKRELTVSPSQALFMMNDEFLHQRSMAYARRLIDEVPVPQDQIVRLFKEAYSRRPTTEELHAAQEFQRQYRQTANTDEPVVSLAAYVRAILCSNEFLHLN